MQKVIKLGVASVNKKSQCNAVYSTDGICFTLTSGVHGYAMGYIVVEVKDGKTSNSYRRFV